jgi:hypothetical protein
MLLQGVKVHKGSGRPALTMRTWCAAGELRYLSYRVPAHQEAVKAALSA